jgi:hypothetical protein
MLTTCGLVAGYIPCSQSNRGQALDNHLDYTIDKYCTVLESFGPARLFYQAGSPEKPLWSYQTREERTG